MDDFKEKVNKRIEEAKTKIIENMNPYKIILFGSFARGKCRKNSSIDILIIADTNLEFFDRIKDAIKLTHGNPPIEPLIYTAQEFEHLREESDVFIENIIEEGVELYSRD